MPGVTHYESTFARLEGALRAGAPDWLHDARRRALAEFKAQGFPSLRKEEWRFTRTRPIAEREFGMVERYTPNGVSAEALTRLTFDDASCHRIVVADGHFARDLSRLEELPAGVRVTSLREAIARDAALVERHLGRCADPAANPFVALNTAFLNDGVFVHVADGVELDTPVHVAFVSRAEGTVSHPRALIVAGRGARVSVVESYAGTGADYWTNAVTEIVCGENASVTHCRIQREVDGAFHVASQQAQLASNSRFSTENVSLGGTLARNDIGAVLGGEGIDARLDGLYLADGRGHAENHTFIRHAQPHCHSFELYKGILGGKARGVFNGKIHVDPGAQKTDAKQENNCILLSDDARINTNPQLEIFADDVKCTHGATVGQLDEMAVFYMRSRGVPHARARSILVYAFAAEVLERIAVEAVRERLEADLFGWLSRTLTL
jgi:Fe-S cluster assembly protein SufD